MITAKIIKGTLNPVSGDKLTTYELTLPKYLVAEINKHNILHNSCQSSRAVPYKKMIDSIKETPFVPYHWQKPHKGMQGFEYYDNTISQKAKWYDGIDKLIAISEGMNDITKQLTNRFLEPVMYVKMVLTGTEWDNLFNQRCPKYKVGDSDIFYSKKELRKALAIDYLDDDTLFKDYNLSTADIHFQILAEQIYDAMNEYEYKDNEWHIPYDIGEEYDIETRLMYSASQCARTSFTTIQDDKYFEVEQNIKLAEGLIKDGHAEPFSHQAQTMSSCIYYSCTREVPVYSYENSINLNFLVDFTTEYGWCRKMRGFISFRHILNI